MSEAHERLRAIPSIDELLALPASLEATGRLSRPVVVDAVREAVETYRKRVREGAAAADIDWNACLQEVYASKLRRTLGRVINATGVVLHTNLGRAPLSPSAIEAVVEVSRGYSNLEYDLVSGERGSRHDHGEELIRRLTGAEAAMVVNNNAAAVLLTLTALVRGREVILSRGEMIEIGGSFRIPDVMAQSGARLVEVGTTNRTRLSDYETAIGPQTGALLKVHTSNYRITGFTASVEGRELGALARRHGIVFIEDLGSGVLIETERYGLAHEPTVGEAVKSGADAVTFSGDKLLGGPQIGVIAGRKDAVARCRRHPLARALRVDKMTLAAFCATLRAYLDRRTEDLPIWRMMARTPEEIRSRAEAVARAVTDKVEGPTVRLVEGRSAIGGGSLPGETLPTWLVAISHPSGAERLAEALRKSKTPIIGRIEDDAYLLDLRTVDPEDDALVARAVLQAVHAKPSGKV